MGIVDCLRAVVRSQPVLQEHRTVMVSWASPRHRFLTSSGLTAGPLRVGIGSTSKPAHGPAFELGRFCTTLRREYVRTVFHGEFDPGSGRTLAACLTHASRAERLPSGSTRAANG